MTVLELIDAILSKIPWVNEYKTLIGTAGFLIVLILHEFGAIDAATAMKIELWVGLWSGVSFGHKGIKAWLKVKGTTP